MMSDKDYFAAAKEYYASVPKRTKVLYFVLSLIPAVGMAGVCIAFLLA